VGPEGRGCAGEDQMSEFAAMPTRTPIPRGSRPSARLSRLVVALATLACTGVAAAPGHAVWLPTNLKVSADVLTHARSTSVSDGAGGQIMVFEEDYRGNVDLYVQRINSSGSRLWGSSNGVALCTAAGNQRFPAIVADGAGGAIIAWQDPRGGATSDIYVQRVSASGNPQWTANGIALCAAINNQDFPAIDTDGSSGAIVTWLDGRSGSGFDIYARRVTSAGAPQWTADGVAVCTAAGTQSNARIVTDGLGGGYVVWQDPRSGNADIYAQRINSAGTPQWTNNGVALCAVMGEQEGPSVISDGFNGAIAAWRDGRYGTGYDVYAQRVGTNGLLSWVATGDSLCTAAGDQGFPAVVSDGSGGAVVAWEDGRGADLDIYAQRIDGFGTLRWSTDGVAVCSAAGTQTAPRLVQDGSNGAIVAWSDHRNADYDLYARRINGAGAPQWGTDGVPLCTAAGNVVGVEVVVDGFGGLIATWDDLRAASDVYARRIDNTGTPLWTADGVRACFNLDEQENQSIVPDGAGGMIVFWDETVRGNSDIYAQRVDGNGVLLWAANGVAVCTASGSQVSANAVSDGAGGAIVAWSDSRTDESDVYAQRINASGASQWASNGVALTTAIHFQYFPVLISDGASGAIAVWSDTRSGDNDIYARRISSAGVPQWTADGVALCTALGGQYSYAVATDGAGGAIVCWQDYRGGATADIYARRILSTGVAQWTLNGVPLCTATDDQTEPQLVADGSGGAIVAWRDARGGRGTDDIYARQITGAGGPQGVANGVAVCSAANTQLRPQIVSDLAGGAVIAWGDLRSGTSSDIYAQRINAAIAPQWLPADGVALCTNPANQVVTALVSDGASGAIAVWSDYRFTFAEEDVFTRRISATGVPQGAADGAAVCIQPGRQVGATMISDGVGGAFLAWQDLRSGTSWDIYAHRIGPSGPLEVPVAEARGGLWLGPAFPNPAPGNTTFRFRLPDRMRVALTIYDLQGRRVRELIGGTLESGPGSAQWDGRDESGQIAPGGVYVAMLEAGGKSVSRKLIEIR
jgi:flagellar hook capping protein FlgD